MKESRTHTHRKCMLEAGIGEGHGKKREELTFFSRLHSPHPPPALKSTTTTNSGYSSYDMSLPSSFALARS